MTLKLCCHKTILAPDLALLVELLERLFEECLVWLTQVIIVSGKYFLSAGHGIEGIAVIS